MATITWPQDASGSAGTASRRISTSGSASSAAWTAAAKPSRSTASAPPAGSLWASPARMISEPQRRISSCSSPTALWSASSERNELEQTSSASVPVLCASVAAHRAHLVEDRRRCPRGRAARPPRCRRGRRRSRAPLPSWIDPSTDRLEQRHGPPRSYGNHASGLERFRPRTPARFAADARPRASGHGALARASCASASCSCASSTAVSIRARTWPASTKSPSSTMMSSMRPAILVATSISVASMRPLLLAKTVRQLGREVGAPSVIAAHRGQSEDDHSAENAAASSHRGFPRLMGGTVASTLERSLLASRGSCRGARGKQVRHRRSSCAGPSA